ncbi:hypothetical protein J2T57_001676 [Natronocella acetinitrilica]|uniref:Uncharacterized protein n=1 Tax=Natronocella acetinitrilica TaxID=414046 RepID=A0AAE3G2S0_9GAMM|nr:hypothetical protein [Natronocella acetinitrilica]MCP1674574.1 hypothetical protein [Natronocella acetinitrilica]
MKGYLVRLKDAPQEIKPTVGVFWAESPEALWELVEQQLDPALCVYCEIRRGGLFFSAREIRGPRGEYVDLRIDSVEPEMGTLDYIGDWAGLVEFSELAEHRPAAIDQRIHHPADGEPR